MKDLVFALVAIVLVSFALGVVSARSLHRAAYCLAGALLSTAALYVLLASPLLAAVQILLYTGGVLTLVVFALTLTRTVEEARIWRRPVLAAIAAVLVGGAVATQLPRVHLHPVGGLPPPDAAMGRLVFGDHVVAFELLSVLLLAALLGALMVARPERPS